MDHPERPSVPVPPLLVDGPAGVVEGVEVHPQVTRRRDLHIPPIERRAVDGDADDVGREGGEDVLLRGGGETESIQPRRR